MGDAIVILSAERKLGVVCIGRNEGERLQRCLASVGDIPNRVYVDSGSSDGSVASARARGVTVVELLVPPPFTAARARNAGLSRLLRECPDVQFVQMLDGDCELRARLDRDGVTRLLSAIQGLRVVFGRLRERHPERSIYNALCDDEWNVPVGEARGCGGDALFRVAALQQVNFYNPSMIAGEDTEMSIRLRKRGWRLERIDAEMSCTMPPLCASPSGGTAHGDRVTPLQRWRTCIPMPAIPIGPAGAQYPCLGRRDPGAPFRRVLIGSATGSALADPRLCWRSSLGR